MFVTSVLLVVLIVRRWLRTHALRVEAVFTAGARLLARFPARVIKELG